MTDTVDLPAGPGAHNLSLMRIADTQSEHTQWDRANGGEYFGEAGSSAMTLLGNDLGTEGA